MLFKILSMKRFWQLAALVAVAAVPLIMLARKTNDEKSLVPVAGDESDIFERELSGD